MEHTRWYKNAVIYQIYPKSFCDSDGDGIGDIKGIISKLDYLKGLGINCVWLSPIYKSPQEDNGYDISDYRDVYPPYGTLDDFKLMVSEMHKRGIRLIMDLVVNHTSSGHEWFKNAVKDKNSPYRDYYIIRKGKSGGKKPPNNWSGFFGGSTWERIGDTDEYYLHLFAKGQPDLNWENPKIKEEVVSILRYWMDMGVDGFRCDVITLISKKQDFKSRFPSPILCGRDAFINGPRLHEYLKYLYDNAYAYYDSATVGETVLSKLKDVKLLTGEDRHELDMVFNFDHTDTDNYLGVKYLVRPFSLVRFKKSFEKYQVGLEGIGWNSLFIENHDQRRCVGRFGTDDTIYRRASAKMLGTTYFLLKGTPFIYEGQELGMTNGDFESIDEFQDVEIHNMHAMAKSSPVYNMLIGKHLFEVSRDNPRTPMQWTGGENAGFTTGRPWLKINKNKSYINAEAELKDENSVLSYYKKLINIRKENPVVINGKFALVRKYDRNFFIYTRNDGENELLVISSFKKKELKCPVKPDKDFMLILSNYDNYSEKFMPYETRVYIRKINER